MGGECKIPVTGAVGQAVEWWLVQPQERRCRNTEGSGALFGQRWGVQPKHLGLQGCGGRKFPWGQGSGFIGSGTGTGACVVGRHHQGGGRGQPERVCARGVSAWTSALWGRWVLGVEEVFLSVFVEALRVSVPGRPAVPLALQDAKGLRTWVCDLRPGSRPSVTFPSAWPEGRR